MNEFEIFKELNKHNTDNLNLKVTYKIPNVE